MQHLPALVLLTRFDHKDLCKRYSKLNLTLRAPHRLASGCVGALGLVGTLAMPATLSASDRHAAFDETASNVATQLFDLNARGLFEDAKRTCAGMIAHEDAQISFIRAWLDAEQQCQHIVTNNLFSGELAMSGAVILDLRGRRDGPSSNSLNPFKSGSVDTTVAGGSGAARHSLRIVCVSPLLSTYVSIRPLPQPMNCTWPAPLMSPAIRPPNHRSTLTLVAKECLSCFIPIRSIVFNQV